MIALGYCKGYRYEGDGTLMVKVRIPSTHGPYMQSNAGGKTLRNYTSDDNLPWVQSVLLPHLPAEGEVVVLSTFDTSTSNWIVIGLTGASYVSGQTSL